MERDFLGLLAVKEENIDITVDSDISAQGRELGMQWSFVNKISSPSQYLSFRASQQDRPRKNVHDQLDSNLKSCANGAQKVMVIEKSAGTNYPIPVYSLQHVSAHSIGRSLETGMLPSSNQPKRATAITASPPAVHSHISPIMINPQPLGVPVLPPASVLPTTGSIIGSTDLRNGSKQNGGVPAQLTIFYAGTVSVFDDVTPEKAQAIMLLAGNRTPVTHHKPVTDEESNGSGTHSPAFLGLPGSISSLAVPPSQANPICNLELAPVKSVGPLKSLVVTQQERPRGIRSAGSPPTQLFSSVALPQARKASLARFLEKRKERVMSTSPYPASQKSPESSISKESGN